MKRREFFSLLGGAAVWPLAARAQQASPVRRVGVLMPDSTITRSWFDAFHAGLEKLGWSEGRNVTIEQRWAAGPEPLRIGAEELAASKPDVILAGVASSLIQMKTATSTVPIVFANVPDPISNGFVPSLTRPGGNITGFASYELAVGIKWLELLKQIAPRVAHALFIYDEANPASPGYVHAAEASSGPLGVEVSGARVHIPLGTVRDWEQGRYEPDAAARAYLRVIARAPGTVRKVLAEQTKTK